MPDPLPPAPNLRSDDPRQVLDPDPKTTSVPVAIVAAGEPIHGSAERLGSGAAIFTPAKKTTLAVGTLVTTNWSLSGPVDREWSGRKREEALMVVERFTDSGEERFLLLAPEACKEPKRSPRPGRNRRKGFRLDVAAHPIEASFQIRWAQPPCKGTVGDLSVGGAALAVPRGIEERATGTVELDVTLALFPRTPPIRVRTVIRNRRLVGNHVVWGLSFRLDASPEPIRAEAAIRDYLIREQIAAMRKRTRQQPGKSSQPTFHIPTRTRFWEACSSGDENQSTGSDAWNIQAAKRARAIASRLYPAVDFVISEDPPATQTYGRGSLNREIRAVLENCTALRLTASGLAQRRPIRG